ncbi:MAG: hypothetical protein COB29_10990 [Sulfitobacter sp.]|nr:MAG: hypothetical protein COB29_10990 [Sulfitobacter sp.]
MAGIETAMGLVSIVLGVTSILQNIKEKDDTAEKIGLIREASLKIALAHDFLSEAKDFHDEFENLVNISLTPILSDFEFVKSDQNQKEKLTKRLLDAEKKFVNNRELIKIAVGDGDVGPINPMRQEIDKIASLIPELDNSLNSYSSAIISLDLLCATKNFGTDLESTLRQIDTQTVRIKSNADRIIFNMLPIVKWLHFELHAALGDLP